MNQLIKTTAQTNQLKPTTTTHTKPTNPLLTVTIAIGACILLTKTAQAAGTAVQLDMVDNLGATVKDLMKGAGSVIIDGIILAGGGWMSAKTSSPVPLIGAVVTAGVFELFTKLIMT